MLFVFYGPIIPSVTHKGLYSIGLLNTFSGSSLPSFAPIASGSGVFKIWQKGGHGERAERDPITGVWGRSPQRGPGTEALVGDQGGEAPLKLKHFASECSIETANSPIFLKFGKGKKLLNIVEFCNSCWKMAKTHLFI